MYTDIKELDRWNQPDEGDPLIWIRRHREELSKKYPTIDELGEYYSNSVRLKPPVRYSMPELPRNKRCDDGSMKRK